MSRTPHWRFRAMQPGEMNVDPIEGEFFTTEALKSVTDALVRESIQNSLDAAAGREPVTVITNRGIMESLHILYFDQIKNKPKRGPIMAKGAPGSLYRFIDVIQQLDVTYDLYSMSGPEITGILPAEFSHWAA
jgi:hypothetical protein